MTALVKHVEGPSTVGQGILEGYISTHAVDLMGDRVMPGAFEDSLNRISEGSSLIMVGYNHDVSGGDPYSIIGTIDVKNGDCFEDTKGLWARIHLDVDWNPKARQVFKLAQRGLLSFSFMYEVREERRAKDGANNLIRLDILEATCTPMPANPDAHMTAVKMRGPVSFAERRKVLSEWWAKREQMWDEYHDRRAHATLTASEKADLAYIENARQCVNPTCRRWLTEPPAKSPSNYGYLFSLCPKCGTVNLDLSDAKALTPIQRMLESNRIKSRQPTAAQKRRGSQVDAIRQLREWDRAEALGNSGRAHAARTRATVAAEIAEMERSLG